MGCRTSRRAPPQFWQAEARRRRDGDECRKRLRKWPAGPASLQGRRLAVGRPGRPAGWPGRPATAAAAGRDREIAIDRAIESRIDREGARDVRRSLCDRKVRASSPHLSPSVFCLLLLQSVLAPTRAELAAVVRAARSPPRCGAWACVAYGPRRCCAVARRSPRVACSPTTCSIAPPASRQPCPCHDSLPRVPRSPSVRTGQA